MPSQNDGLVARATTTIAADPDDGLAALVEPAAIKQYMFGTTVESDWSEGSPIVWKGEWQGRAYEDKGTILRLEPGRLLQYTPLQPALGPPGRAGELPHGDHRAGAEGAGTSVTLTQDGSTTEEARQHSEENWSDDARLPQGYVEGRGEVAA